MSQSRRSFNMNIPYMPRDTDFPPNFYYPRSVEVFPPKLSGVEPLYDWYKTLNSIERSYMEDVYRQLRCVPQPGREVTITERKAFTLACENTELTRYIVKILEARHNWAGTVDFTSILVFQHSDEGRCIENARGWWLTWRKRDFADRLRKSFRGALHFYEQICKQIHLANSYEFDIDWCGQAMLHYYRALASREFIGDPVGINPCDTAWQKTYLLAALTPRGRYIQSLLQELHCFTSILERKGIDRSRFLRELDSLDPESQEYPLSRKYSQAGDGGLLGWTPTPSTPATAAARPREPDAQKPFEVQARRRGKSI